MSELRDLYQQVILDHNKRPCNFRVMDDCHHTAEGYNPLCGDRVTVYLKLDSGLVDLLVDQEQALKELHTLIGVDEAQVIEQRRMPTLSDILFGVRSRRPTNASESLISLGTCFTSNCQ